MCDFGSIARRIMTGERCFSGVRVHVQRIPHSKLHLRNILFADTCIVSTSKNREFPT